ncbi:MAG: hypothetical protein Q7J27_01220 [Syntrophales bacterium]|nr:hypothetical protein [Syntrophales bacterium]
MEKNEFIEKCFLLEKDFRILYADGVIAVHEGEIQIDGESFLNRFSKWEVRERSDDMFPWELFCISGGIKFFAVVNKKPEDWDVWGSDE